jgi:hypothetical protein
LRFCPTGAWMGQLYRSKGGQREFDLTPLRLIAADLSAMMKNCSGVEIPLRAAGIFVAERALLYLPISR